jgi:hypothetical protein
MNKGAAFSFLADKPWGQTFFKIITPIALILFGIMFFLAFRKNYKFYLYGVTFMITGTLGNFIESAEKLIADLKAKYNGDVNSLCDAVYSKEEKTSIDKLNFKLIAEKEKILLAYELKKIRTELNVKLFGGFSDEKNLRIRLDELGVSLGERYFDKFIESKNMSRIISDLNKRRNLF